jgi:hypothetical protein
MDEDINSFLLFCGANTASANQNLQPGIELYHNRGVLLSPIVAGFLSTTTRKKLLIEFHLSLVTTMWISELTTTKSADCFSQNPTVDRRVVFPISFSRFVTNLSPYKCRGVGVPTGSNKRLATLYCPAVM